MANERVNVKFDFCGKIRRLVVEGFEELQEKVRQAEPTFCGYLAWIDEESDKIAVESEDDFAVAVEVFKATNAGACLKLVCVESTTAEESADGAAASSEPSSHESVVKVTHPFIYCDNCEHNDERMIEGMRYKCAVCDDFDLCEVCEKKGIHAEHPMIRYVTPDTQRIEDFHAFQPFQKRPQGFGCPYKAMNLQEIIESRTTRKEAKERRREQRHARREARRQERDRTAHDQQKEIERLITERATKVRNNVRTGVEYLKEIGGQLQQALMNFGIDCDVDVEHRGQRYPLNEYIKKEEAEQKKKEEVAEGTKTEEAEKEELKPEMTSTPLQRPSSIPIRHPAPADIYQSLMQQVATPSEVLERAAAMMHAEKEKFMPKSEEQEEAQSERELRECGEALAMKAAERLNEAINSHQQAQEAAYRFAMQAASDAISKLNISSQSAAEQLADSEEKMKSFVSYSDSETDPEDEKTVHDIVDVSMAPTPNPTPAVTQTNTPPSELEQGRVDDDWFVMENSNSAVHVHANAVIEEVHEPTAPYDETAVPEITYPEPEVEPEELPVCTAGIPMHVPGRNSIRTPGPHNPRFGYIHPNPEIQRTAEILVDMGYDNCNGWLTRLSEENNGDINRVIEASHRDPLHLQRVGLLH